jgi:hypothetical protein
MAATSEAESTLGSKVPATAMISVIELRWLKSHHLTKPVSVNAGTYCLLVLSPL